MSNGLKEMTTPLPIMKGGAKEYITDLVLKFKTPISLFTATILVLAIVYQREIPDYVKYQFGTTIGRIFTFLLTLYIGIKISWIHGLLMALFVTTVLAVTPVVPSRIEQFQNQTTKLAGDDNQQWFVERVLREGGQGVTVDRVKTQAAQ